RAAALALLLAACGDARMIQGEAVPAGSLARCTACHGDRQRIASSGTDPLIAAAPPAGLLGAGDPGDRAVGAHQAHLRGGAFWSAVACASCHALPAGTDHPRQEQGKVTFSGVAATVAWPGARAFDPPPAPSWNGAAPGGPATCSATYCHGSFPNGAGPVEISWTSGSAPCGSCHAVPPPDPHPPVGGETDRCAECHPGAGGGASHVNGRLEVSIPGHDASWIDPASPGFHAFTANLGLAACTRCHGATLDGGAFVPGCGSCHDRSLPAGVASWRTNCVMCHGGEADQTGAPPRATWGRAGDPVRVGAHRSHVGAAHALAEPLGCEACHAKPADALDAGHVDGPTATVAFGGLASKGTAPAWSRGEATCSSTYCHGATLAGGTNTSPIWTVLDGTQAACGTCHGNPPATGRHGQHVISWSVPCFACHPRVAGRPFDPSLHVNGTKDMNRSPDASVYGGFADWDPGAAGPGTLTGTATGCHGATNYWTGAPPPPRFGCQ
ncbi:MAG TPA: CxxxxCH/CxxCH domain-containing protein, partial [Anaeromyxobacter sp.]